MIKSSARLLPPAQADAERQRSQQQQQQEQEQRPRQRRRPLGLGDNVIAVNQPAQPLLRTESSFSFSLAKPRAESTTDHTGHCRTVGAGHRSDQRSAVSRAKEARDSTGSRSRRILQLSFGSLSLPLDQEDTPSDLRRLEKGWREKRRVWAEPNLSLSGRRHSHALNTDHRAGNGENGGQSHSDGGGLSIDMGKGAGSVRAVSVPMNAIRGRPLPTQMDINSEEEGKWELLDPALMEPAASQIEREQALLRSNHQPHPHRRCQIKSSRTSMKTARPSGARTTQAQNVRFSVTPPSVLPTPPPSPPQPSPRRVATISSQEGDGALVNDAGVSRPARAGRLRHRRPPFCQPSEKPPLGGRDEGGDGDSNGGTTSPSLSPRASLARTRHVQSDHPSSIPASSSGRIQAQAQARTRPEAEAQKPFTPILADPLPPTLRPVPISKADSDTIYVHPLSSPLELTLHLQGGRRIEVYRGGLEVRLSDRRYTEGEEEKQDEEPEKVRPLEGRMMKLEESDYWTKEEWRDWANLAGVVEGFKRITPRIKLYHPLGHLTITCSSPPDIILTFQLEVPPSLAHTSWTLRGSATRPSDTADTAQTCHGATKIYKIRSASALGSANHVPLEAGQRSSSLEIPSRWVTTSKGYMIKVRATYSRSKKEMRIDTDSCSTYVSSDDVDDGREGRGSVERRERRERRTKMGQVQGQERYRTKRVVSLHAGGLPKLSRPAIRPLPDSTLLAPAENRERVIPAATPDHRHTALRESRLEDAEVCLGILGDINRWREEEEEALRRIWALRDEWLRWE